MNKYKADELIVIGNRQYIYESNDEVIKVYTLSGNYITEKGCHKDVWETNPKGALERLKWAQPHTYRLTDKDRETMRDMLIEGTDWKELAIREREQNKKREASCLENKKTTDK